jgi:hypothetical protein
MCLIVRGTVADLLCLDLERAQRSNSDGWGVHTSRGVYYSFGRKDDSIVNFLGNKRADMVATIHFRYATHGDVNIMNAHPFHLGEQEFLMHNGVLHGPDFQHKTKSDTMRLAEILMDAGPKSRAYILESLCETEWYSNRFCTLKGKNWQKFGDWEYDKETDTWHSNRSLLSGWGHVPAAKSSTATTLLWDQDSRSWVPKTPAASITHGRMYNKDYEADDIDCLSDREIEELVAEYNADKNADRMPYVDVDETDTDVIVDITDPFHVGTNA